jgi:FkbM family methyltransferase
MDFADTLHKGALGRVLRSPLRLLPKGSCVPILMGPLRGKRWIIGSQRHACWLGMYEPGLQRLVNQRVQPGRVFYDIGANAGFYTLLAAMRVGAGKVFAFEPVPENVDSLKRHIELNALDNVSIVQAAVSDENGSATFRLGNTRCDGRLSSNGNFKVRVLTLDALLSEKQIPPPSYIKMDIEGEEFRALLGGKECFARYRPELFLSTHGEVLRRSCFELLTSWGYEVRTLNQGERERAQLLALSRK